MAKRSRNNVSRGQQSKDTTGRFAYEGLVRVFHEKARLGIMASLTAHPDGLLFNDLKQLCELTDGNLSRHLAILSESNFVDFYDSAIGSRTQTLVKISAVGAASFRQYLAELERVIHDAQAARTPSLKAGAKTILRPS